MGVTCDDIGFGGSYLFELSDTRVFRCVWSNSSGVCVPNTKDGEFYLIDLRSKTLSGDYRIIKRTMVCKLRVY